MPSLPIDGLPLDGSPLILYRDNYPQVVFHNGYSWIMMIDHDQLVVMTGSGMFLEDHPGVMMANDASQ